MNKRSPNLTSCVTVPTEPIPHLSTANLMAYALELGIAEVDLPSELPEATRRVPLEGAYNFRETGGYPTTDHRWVRSGLVFRTDHLNELTDADVDTLESIGIRNVYDFRLNDEVTRQPSRLPGSITPVQLGFGDSGVDGTMIDVVRDMLAGRRAVPDASFWDENYLTIVDSGRPMFVQLFAALANPANLPAVFHCTGGKDRTGLANAMLLTALGVDQAIVIDDFLLTNVYRTPFRIASLAPSLRAVGVEVTSAIPIIGVCRSALVSALSHLDTHYGGLETYLADGGLSSADLSALRANLIEAA
jgi:protein-tyrosine phosphatase